VAKLSASINALGEHAEGWGFSFGPHTQLAVDRYTEALLPHTIDLLTASWRPLRSISFGVLMRPH
jgi:hypothetical protein